MTRDEVKSIIKDITDEQLNGLMDLNSRDIGKAKGKSDDQKAELESLRTQLAEKDETIANLEKAKGDAATIQAELDKSQAATVNAEKFMGIVKKHLAFEELTPTLLREMVEKIIVHECSYDENGTRRQDIEIYYSFVGKIDLPEA